MDFKPEIELYSSSSSDVVDEELFQKLGRAGIVKFEKKLSYYSGLTMATLLKTGTLDFINGSKPRFHELKVKNLKFPVRIVSSIQGHTLLLLVPFFESGSDGVVEKHLRKAEQRLSEWLV